MKEAWEQVEHAIEKFALERKRHTGNEHRASIVPLCDANEALQAAVRAYGDACVIEAMTKPNTPEHG